MLLIIPFMLFFAYATRDSYNEYVENMATPRVASIMQDVDRKYYTPSPSPYALIPLSIYEGGVNMSAPSVHAFALDLALKHKPSAKNVMDVGSGSGYLSACFAHLYPTAEVYGVERIKALVAQSRLNVSNDPANGKEGVLDRLHFVEANALNAKDLASLPQMDIIHMGTAHVGVPEALKEKLAVGGVLIFPEETMLGEQYFVVYEKKSDGNLAMIDNAGGVWYIQALDRPPS
jgi:protein-L-isoaspartate(D-aspartate) O-methyltransferase